MGSAEESDCRDPGPRGAGRDRSEWRHYNPRSGRLRVVDAAHRGFRDHSRVARSPASRAVDSRSDDAACTAAIDGQWLVGTPERTALISSVISTWMTAVFGSAPGSP